MGQQLEKLRGPADDGADKTGDEEGEATAGKEAKEEEEVPSSASSASCVRQNRVLWKPLALHPPRGRFRLPPPAARFSPSSSSS